MNAPDEQPVNRLLPLWLKWAMTVFTVVLIVVYWRAYGVTNFLWFCDVALFCTVVGLWREDRLLLSMVVLAVTLAEVPWTVDFFAALITGSHPLGHTTYMFDRTHHCFVRVLSLFHIFLPIVAWWSVWRLGYDRRALIFQTVLAWVLMIGAFLLTIPEKNMNLVFGLFGPQNTVPPLVYLAVWMVIMPAVVYLPVHAIAGRLRRHTENGEMSGGGCSRN